MKTLRYAVEGLLLHILFFFFKCLPANTASNIGGWLGKTIGPLLAVNRKAYRHIEMALPEKTQKERDQIVRGMWDNLGRVIAEYPHLEQIAEKYTDVTKLYPIKEYIDDDKPVVFISGHLSNWEMNAAATLVHLNHGIDLTYRAPNNPWTEKLLYRSRTMNYKIRAFPKSRESGRSIMNSLKEGNSIGVLIDQKYNEGIEVDFFGIPAMTNPFFIKLCQKYNCPLVPVQNERINGCQFKLTACDPIKLFNDDETPRPAEDVLQDIHALLESWIRKNPEQWIWLHRRWKETEN